MEPQTRRILIINGKGGCGKTTIATNLAVAYASEGHGVALMDHDSQASATDWIAQRPADLPDIVLVPANRRASMYQTQVYHLRLPEGTDRIVIDAASATSEHNLDDLLRLADVVIVPILPSSIDIRAGSKFIADLLTHKAYRKNPLPVAVVANRVRHKTAAHDRLKDFLECLDVPTAASFRDISLYTEAAEEGTGICDIDHLKGASQEVDQWHRLMDWIESQDAPRGNLRRAAPIRSRLSRADIRQRVADARTA